MGLGRPTLGAHVLASRDSRISHPTAAEPTSGTMWVAPPGLRFRVVSAAQGEATAQ